MTQITNAVQQAITTAMTASAQTVGFEVGTLANQLSQLEASVQALTGQTSQETAQLLQSTQDNAAQIQTLLTNLTALDNDTEQALLDAVNNLNAARDAAVAQINQTVADFQAQDDIRFADINTAIAGVNASIDTINSSLAPILTRLSAIESKMNHLETNASAIGAAAGDAAIQAFSASFLGAANP